MASSRQSDKAQQERLQMIIAELLKDEENKYCADCDAKGPRWASWNLGVLLCIRCAGIHRGLGVHISKVKSLNLDSWEPQQVAMLKAVGNRRARQLYEANLPEFFRRPQADSALEQFIRAKYEQKRYVPSDFVPPKPDIESIKKELSRLEQMSKRKAHPVRAINLQIQNAEAPKPQGRTLKSIAMGASSNPGGGIADIFGLSSPSTSRHLGGEINSPPRILETAQNPETPKKESAGSFSSDLLGISFGEPSQPSHQSSVTVSNDPTVSGSGERRPTTKESILALYNLPKPVPSTTSAPAVGANSGQNGNAVPSFAVAATSGQMPPTCQPSAPQPTTASNFSWTSLKQQQQPQAAPRFHPPSTDPFDSMDVFQSAAPTYAAKPVSQWDDAFSSCVSQPISNAPFSFQTPSQLQPQWPSSSAFQQAPVAATAATNLNSSAQQSYLTQIQSQLASMQLRSETVE
ncbi:unnamed protein product [Hymenolepis diminuta]|uniref:Arf-GAP domain-containing protein n=2 Tax=Hymenolepis diminuta TaxID=6216 RepID=A0A564YP25_HYMDI|nr:unnamed protein product [Hymenolepis diminuta]